MDYLTDLRDRAVFGATPCLMQPRYGQLPELPLFQHRFVIAADGVYVQACTPALRVCLRLSGASLTAYPYGELQESVTLVGGAFPVELRDEILDFAITACPNEWAGLILYKPDDNIYSLTSPVIESVSPGHVTYKTLDYNPEQVVLDLHTHGQGQPLFSSVDDQSDQEGGIFLSTVLGFCDEKPSIRATTRIVVNGILYPVTWNPWKLPSIVASAA